ncbi:pentatricopeptide repeat (PPR-like) superfamily protein [Wolffia australiana]
METTAIPSTSSRLPFKSQEPAYLPIFFPKSLLLHCRSKSLIRSSLESTRSFPSSLPIHDKNPHAICRDIQRLARQGKLKEALTLLDYFEQRGVPVNATTFSHLLSACARLKALSEGRQIHVHLRINGHDRNSFLLTKLVQMYASCGATDEAGGLFSELSPDHLLPWNALLRGTVVGGRRWSHATLSAFSEMRRAGVVPNEYSFSCLVKSLAGSPSPLMGMNAHALLIKSGHLPSSTLLATSLIDMYFKSRKIRMAMKVFDETPHRDIVLWGAVIAGFAHHGLNREALDYLRFMAADDGIAPNSVILATVLPAAGELGDGKLGRELHGYAVKYLAEFQRWPFIHSALIDMYCKSGDLGSARRVFNGCDQRTAVSWTALMAGYVSNGRPDQALRAIVWMQRDGLKADVVAVAAVLPVCAELGALKLGKQIHGYSLRQGFLPNVSISTSLMTMYAGLGKLNYSARVFSLIERKNIISWTAMIDSLGKNGDPAAAIACFRSMVSAGLHRLDYVSASRILRLCGELVAARLGKEVHARVLRLGLCGAALVAAELVAMYGRCGMVDQAKAVFDRVDSRGSLTWTAVIGAHAVNGLAREALALFGEMVAAGFKPSRFTIDEVLSVCEGPGLVNEAVEAFDLLTSRFKLMASDEQFDRLVGILKRAGRVDEARRFSRLRSVPTGRPGQSQLLVS